MQTMCELNSSDMACQIWYVRLSASHSMSSMTCRCPRLWPSSLFRCEHMSVEHHITTAAQGKQCILTSRA